MCYNVKVNSLTHLSGQVCASGVVMCCFEVNDNNVTPDSSIAWPARKWSWIGPWSATVGLFFSITSNAFVSLWPCAWSFSVLSWKTPLSSSHSLRDGFAVLACFLSSLRWLFLSRFLLKPNTVRDFSCKNHWRLAAHALWDFYKIRKLSKICIMLLLIVAFYPLHIGAQGFKGLTWTGTSQWEAVVIIFPPLLHPQQLVIKRVNRDYAKSTPNVCCSQSTASTSLFDNLNGIINCGML